MTTIRIVCLIMVMILLLTTAMIIVVFGRVAPVLQAFLNMGSGPSPQQPSTTVSVPTEPSSEPTEPPTTEATEPPTTGTTEPPHDHNFAKLKKRQVATCTEIGYDIFACDCGATEIINIRAPKGHNYGAGEKFEPTCTEEGYTLYSCDTCGHKDKRNVVAAVGHEYEAGEPVEGSCTEDAYTPHTCTVCGHVEKKDLVEAPGHTGDWVIVRDPSETDPGEETLECTVCGETVTRPVELSAKLSYTATGTNSDGEYTLYVIHVGPVSDPDMFIYQIYDYSHSETLTWTYGADGLTVIISEDSTGKLPARVTADLFIDADGNVKGDEEPDDPNNPDDTTGSTGTSASGDTTGSTEGSTGSAEDSNGSTENNE